MKIEMEQMLRDRLRRVRDAVEFHIPAGTAYLTESQIAAIIGCNPEDVKMQVAGISGMPAWKSVPGTEGTFCLPTKSALDALEVEYAGMLAGAGLPRGEGEHVPQSPVEEGNLVLLYSEQNFNALAVANAEQRGVIEGQKREIELLLKDIKRQEQISDDRADLLIERGNAIGTLKSENADLKSKVAALEEESERQKREITYRELKLQRTFGYLDRMLESDEAEELVSRPPSPGDAAIERGPRVNDIPQPSRMRIVMDGDDMRAFQATPLRSYGQERTY